MYRETRSEREPRVILGFKGKNANGSYISHATALGLWASLIFANSKSTSGILSFAQTFVAIN